MKMVHVTIQARYFEESVQFYQEIPCLQIVKDMRSNPAHQIVFLADAQGDTCVEIVEDPAAPYSGSGISIGFAVDDVRSFREELEKKGLNPGDIISPNPHTQFFFLKDPNGVSIQFIQQG